MQKSKKPGPPDAKSRRLKSIVFYRSFRTRVNDCVFLIKIIFFVFVLTFCCGVRLMGFVTFSFWPSFYLLSTCMFFQCGGFFHVFGPPELHLPAFHYGTSIAFRLFTWIHGYFMRTEVYWSVLQGTNFWWNGWGPVSMLLMEKHVLFEIWPLFYRRKVTTFWWYACVFTIKMIAG